VSDLAETFPRRRITAGALLFNQRGELLIVKPTYRDDECWLIPGGRVEENESPMEGCRREIREELGHDLTLERLLCIEYQSRGRTKPQSVHFVFHGGVLSERLIQRIQLPADELGEFRFSDWPQARELLCLRLVQRLVFALKALEQGRVIYLEDLVEASREFSK
jgi:8-oxo-dGTP pyrophosphatase MutT (NUDIX family)